MSAKTITGESKTTAGHDESKDAAGDARTLAGLDESEDAAGDARMLAGLDESEDAAGDARTLKSLVTDATEELDIKLDLNERSPAAKRWKQTISLLRTARAFKYLEKEPTDEAVAEVKSRSLSFKSRSIEADKPEDGMADLSMVVDETGEEEEEDEPLKPLALKYRVAGSLLSKMQAIVFKKDGTMERTIHEYADLRVKAESTPVDGFYTTDVQIDPECEVWARIFAPDDTKSKDVKHPVVVYFHGGGFAEFHADSTLYDSLCRKIAKALDAVVISVNYRRSPEHRYPIQYEDCFKAIRWLQKTPAGSDSLPATADVSRTILAGDSAGGNITHHMGCRAAAADLGPIKIRAWILLQPFFGGVERTKSELTVPNPFLLTLTMADWFWQAVLPHGADRDHEAANVVGPKAPDLKGLPLLPIFLVIGTHDILKDRQLEYGKMMATVVGKENVLVKKYSYGFHAFFAFDLVLQKALMNDMQSFVQRALAK